MIEVAVSKKKQQCILVLLVNNTDLASDRDNINKNAKILDIYNRLYYATSRHIEDIKIICYSWLWKW